MALLERVAGLMDNVQVTQQRMEERQLELENTVKTIQADVVKLTNDHANTSSTVDRLLEKTRKVSRHIKDVRVRVENQNIRVKKVEATQGDLLAKNKFRVVIYQVRLPCSSDDAPTISSWHDESEGGCWWFIDLLLPPKCIRGRILIVIRCPSSQLTGLNL